MTESERRATVVDVSCSVCGKRVGYRELYPPDVPRPADRGPEHPARSLDRAWEYVGNGDREGFGGLSLAELDRAIESLAGDQPERFMALYCHECRLVYCFAHWRVEYSNDPPRSFGRCPRGHGHVIDMG